MSQPFQPSEERRRGPSPEEAEAIATLAYIYGYPLVLMDATRRSVPWPSNQFTHLSTLPEPTFKDGLSPNVDTLASTAWLDLGREPIVLAVPDLGQRYYLMQIVDAWTNVIAAPGTRTTGNGKAAFALTGPGWRATLPEGLGRIEAPTNMVWIIGRTQAAGKREAEVVHALQAQYQLVPLSAWGRPVTPPRSTFIATKGGATPPVTQVEKLSAARFFARLADLLEANPPAEDDDPMMDRLARLGLIPGEPFELAQLSPLVADAFESGVAAARARLRGARTASFGQVVNGWRIVRDLGRYGAKYERRAQVALMGLGTGLAEDAISPWTDVDREGKPLGGAHRYRLRFAAGGLPPVKGLWSLTMYGEDHLLVANPLSRYAIGDRDPLQIEPDGTLEILIQAQDPGPERRSNWLPAPAGAFNLIMRLYYPKPAALDGTWRPPGLVRV
jgi:hypothetical protein